VDSPQIGAWVTRPLYVAGDCTRDSIAAFRATERPVSWSVGCCRFNLVFSSRPATRCRITAGGRLRLSVTPHEGSYDNVCPPAFHRRSVPPCVYTADTTRCEGTANVREGIPARSTGY